MRVVIDTNDFISALIGKKHREKLSIVLAKSDIELVADNNLLTEISDVAYRDKFRRYITPGEIALFLEAIQARMTLITLTTIVTDSPDPDDNYLLALAIDARATYLITGDKNDLLALSPYRGIQIIRLQAFLDLTQNQ